MPHSADYYRYHHRHWNLVETKKLQNFITQRSYTPASTYFVDFDWDLRRETQKDANSFEFDYWARPSLHRTPLAHPLSPDSWATKCEPAGLCHSWPNKKQKDEAANSWLLTRLLLARAPHLSLACPTQKKSHRPSQHIWNSFCFILNKELLFF